MKLSVLSFAVVLQGVAGLALRPSSASSRRSLLTRDAPAAVAVIAGAWQAKASPALAATDAELFRDLAAASKSLADLPKVATASAATTATAITAAATTVTATTVTTTTAAAVSTTSLYRHNRDPFPASWSAISSGIRFALSSESPR